MIRRTLAASLILCTTPVRGWALQAPAAGQGPWIPIDQLPPADQMPAAPLLIAAYGFVWVATLVYLWSIWRRLRKVEDEMQALQRRAPGGEQPAVTAGHFLFIPSVLLIGIVIGWVLGSRAARDAYAAELMRREERATRAAAGQRSQESAVSRAGGTAGGAGGT